jgi:hypothetical protein
MNDVVIISAVWIAIGGVWTYYSDKRAYKEGMMDAVVMHNRGNLTYEIYLNEDGEEMIEMVVTNED